MRAGRRAGVLGLAVLAVSAALATTAGGARTPPRAQDAEREQTAAQQAAASAEVRPEVARLAANAIKKMPKKAHSVLMAQMASCFGEKALCDEMDTAVRSQLIAAVPGARFVAREDAVKDLDGRGFLAIDAYLGALDDVAGDAGADAVISESVGVRGDKCEMAISDVEAKPGAPRSIVKEAIDCPMAADAGFTLMMDPNGGAAIPVPNAQGRPPVRSGGPLSAAQDPQCTFCPAPHYSGDLERRGAPRGIRVLATVTRVGTLASPAVLGTSDGEAIAAALEAMSEWRLIPASDKGGKTYSRRMVFEVQFSLQQGGSGQVGNGGSPRGRR